MKYWAVIFNRTQWDLITKTYQNDGLSRCGDIFAKREGLLRLEESVTICLGGGCLSPLNGDPAKVLQKKAPSPSSSTSESPSMLLIAQLFD